MQIWFKILVVLAFYILTINLNLYIREHNSLLTKQQFVPFHFPAAYYLSIKNIVADFYWFNLATQEDFSPEYMFHRADFITDLDPHFTIVYRFVGIYLTTRTDRHDLVVTLLK